MTHTLNWPVVGTHHRRRLTQLSLIVDRERHSPSYYKRGRVKAYSPGSRLSPVPANSRDPYRSRSIHWWASLCFPSILQKEFSFLKKKKKILINPLESRIVWLGHSSRSRTVGWKFPESRKKNTTQHTHTTINDDREYEGVRALFTLWQ